MSGLLLLVGQFVLAGTLAWSAAGKLRRPTGDRSAFAEFRASLPRTVGVPAAVAGPLAAAVVVAEAATAATLLAGTVVPALALPGHLLATGLMGAFTAAVAVMIRRGVREPCRCFGSGGAPPGPTHLLRNVLLTVVAAGGTVLALGGARPHVTPAAPGWPGGEMPYLPVLLALLIVLCAVNTTVVLLVLRQLRQQSALLKVSIEGVTNPEPIMRSGGGEVDDFTATTVDGTVVSRADLRGETLVAFVSPTCPACAESLPGFIARAAALPGGRDRVLAVVLGTGDAADQLADQLTPVARVVTEPERGPVSRAFGVDGYPAFALLSGHTVVASHFVLDRIPETAAR